MPIKDLLADLGVLPLRAIAFQCVFLLVAIALEAAVLRQQLKLGYKVSMQYAASLNLFATSLGWLTFLGLEPLAPEPLRTQIMSYVLFNRFYDNIWRSNMPIVIVVAGLVCFFATFWVKNQGLEWLMRILGTAPAREPSTPDVIASMPRKERYELARQGRNPRGSTNSTHTLAVLQANALSFSAIVLLLLLRYVLEGS